MTTLVNPFEVQASNASGTYENCPQANYPAVIVGLIDLGTHPVTYSDGKSGEQRKAALLIQIGDQYAKKADGDPFVYAREVSISSFGKKSSARKIAEAVLGKTFADEEKFNLCHLIGKPCMAEVKHNPGKEGKVYANLNSVSALAIGMAAPVPAVPTVLWFHGMGDFPTHRWLPWSYGSTLKQTYEDSAEYRAIHGGPAAGATVATTPAVAPMTATGQTPSVAAGIPDDDVPF